MQYDQAMEMRILGLLRMEIPKTITVDELIKKISGSYEYWEDGASELVRQQVVILNREGLVDVTSVSALEEGSNVEIWINTKGLEVFRAERQTEALNALLAKITPIRLYP